MNYYVRTSRCKYWCFIFLSQNVSSRIEEVEDQVQIIKGFQPIYLKFKASVVLFKILFSFKGPVFSHLSDAWGALLERRRSGGFTPLHSQSFRQPPMPGDTCQLVFYVYFFFLIVVWPFSPVACQCLWYLTCCPAAHSSATCANCEAFFAIPRTSRKVRCVLCRWKRLLFFSSIFYLFCVLFLCCVSLLFFVIFDMWFGFFFVNPAKVEGSGCMRLRSKWP